MNTDRLLKLIEVLEMPEMAGHFCMSEWVSVNTVTHFHAIQDFSEFVHTCGTACCIGGLTNILFTPKDKHRKYEDIIDSRNAENFLDLNADTAYQLFYPSGTTPKGNGYIQTENPKAAVAVLRNLIETGKVDWSVADDVIDQATHSNQNGLED